MRIIIAILLTLTTAASAFTVPLGQNSIDLTTHTVTAFDVQDIRYDYEGSRWIISANAVISKPAIESSNEDVSIIYTVTLEIPRIIVSADEVAAMVGTTYTKEQLDAAITTIALGKVVAEISK